MAKEKKDIKPILVQLGVAVALSFAGFLFSHIRTRGRKSSKPPHSPQSSGCGSEVDAGRGRTLHRNGPYAIKKTPSSSSVLSGSVERHEETYTIKVAVDNSTVVISPGSRRSGDKDGYLLPEFNDLVKEFDFTSMSAGISPKKHVETTCLDVETPRAYRTDEKDDYEQEIRHLRDMVTMLREREKHLEVQLLEFYGLKEQENTVMELKNRLKLSNMEAKFLTLKMESLQADNKRLQEQAVDHSKIASDLDATRAKVKFLKKKLRYDAEQNKEQILTLQKRVSKLQEQELAAASGESIVQLNMRKLKVLETEAEELRKSNLKLHLENVELAHKLESTQILANSVLEDPETEALREFSNHLRQENEDLAKKVERLQADRCSDAEELVYMRWVNACLRYELRNFQPPNGKTVARDLSKSLSPRSEQKAKQLILEYASTEGLGEKGMNVTDFKCDPWSCSQASYMTDSADFDDSSASTKTNSSHNNKIFNKLRRLIWGKDNHHGSLADKAGGLEDLDSPRGSSTISTANDLPSARFQTLSVSSSRHSSRHSVDIERLQSPRMDDAKDMESRNGNGNMGSSFVYRRVSSGGSGGDASFENHIVGDSYPMEKFELAKFAEVLDSGSRTRDSSRTPKYHRKTVSLGSLEAFHRTVSE
uniref:Uncharacterized protein n=1 Tax=Rhizophora mucronata TaxID=61149 RepID=A0A2P2NGS8_RHIMU